MPPKKHKPTKEAAAVDDAKSRRRQWWPWSELPPTNSTTHPHALAANMWRSSLSSAPGITKSWLTPPTRCDAARQRPPRLRHVAPKNPIPPHSHTHFIGDDSSVVAAAHRNPDASHFWCLLKPYTKTETPPPPVTATTPHNPRFYLSGSKLQLNDVVGPNGPSTGLTVKYTVYRDVAPRVYSCRAVSVWHECATADPFVAEKKLLEFTGVVHCRGRFYATSLQGALAVMQVIGTRLTVTGVTATRGVPTSDSRFFKEYLFEMNGEILLVFLIHRKSLAVVDGVEVFRLDLDRLDWVKVERLRGKTVFLKERCVWVDSEEFGCRDDRVYFTEGLEHSWRVYDMESCCISPVLFGWK